MPRNSNLLEKRGITSFVVSHKSRPKSNAQKRVIAKLLINKDEKSRIKTTNSLYQCKSWEEFRARKRFNPLTNTFREAKVGRPALLEKNQEEQIRAMILEHQEANDCLTVIEILDYINDKFGKETSRAWLRGFAKKTNLQLTNSVPLTHSQTNYSDADHCMFLDTLATTFAGVSIHRIANAGETIARNSKDKYKQMQVVVSADCQSPVKAITEEKGKEIPQLNCIWLDGSFCKPLILYEKKHSLKSSFDETQHAVFFNSKASWIDVEVFKWWVENCFLVEVERRRQEFDNDRNEKYYLLMDNQPTHKNLEIIDLLANANVEPIYFLPNSTTVAQPLDRLFNNNIKRNFTKIWKERRTRWPDQKESTCRVLAAACAAYNLTSSEVHSSFGSTGITSSPTSEQKWIASIDKSPFVPPTSSL